jgi:hypothetical protein
VSSQDKAGTVYVSPTRNLWLLLEAWPVAVCLELESGRVQRMFRSIDDLLLYGWRRWEGER